MLNTTAKEWQFLVFLSFAGIAILAVSPYKDSDFNYRLHYIGTCIAMVAVLSLWAARGAWVVSISAISAGLALRAITDKWDWLDWLVTVAGATIGYATKYSLIN